MGSLSEYSRAVTHAHTTESDGRVSPRKLVKAASTHQIDFLTVTDHDTMDGVISARIAGEKFGVTALPGIELTVTIAQDLTKKSNPFHSRHIIGVFRGDETIVVPDHSRSIAESIHMIKQQGGIVILPHVGGGTASLTIEEAARIMEEYEIDGIEVINGIHDRREELRSLLEKYPIAEIGAADSHFGEKDIASAYTKFPGTTVADFFRAVQEHTTIAVKGKTTQISWVEKRLQNAQAWAGLGTRRYVFKNVRKHKTIPAETQELQAA